ncbi:GNAT family N-acetyltransferase, partial [Bacillus sp. D-CC]
RKKRTYRKRNTKYGYWTKIRSIEWNNRTGLLAIGIGDANDRGKGYGREAIHLILKYAFYELNLHRVGLDVISYNKAAIELYKKMGCFSSISLTSI